MTLEEAVDSVSMLLQSSLSTDILETLQLYTIARQFRVHGAAHGLLQVTQFFQMICFVILVIFVFVFSFDF